MRRTKIWPIGREDAATVIEHSDCVFCEGAKHVKWSAPGEAIYFESESGACAVIEAVTVLANGQAVTLCQSIEKEDALAEIREARENTH